MSAKVLSERLLRQARACASLGSPMYANLLERAAEDVVRDGITAEVLAGHEHEHDRSALELRLLGVVHRMVLEGRLPELAAHYPSAGGARDPLLAWPVFAGVLAEYRDEIRSGLGAPPQTNEIGRSVPLIGGLRHVAAATGLPIRLLEIGSSAGLNLRADRFRYRDGPWSLGPEGSPVVFEEVWEPGRGPQGETPVVVDRVGCDVAPIDPTTRQGRLRLLSYVWPDQPDRIARLRAACEVAEETPARLVRAGAADFLAGIVLKGGQATVVWHSVMRQYVSDGEWARTEGELARLAAAAEVDRPFGYVTFEPRSNRDRRLVYAVAVRLWPGGEERIIGEAAAHGIPATWY
ncbi:DUF2332 domain-containing protein [Rhizohabitans arisaemae]|uniref:DUF2332 domain-containing protein n=1 Tax=Rhizohabitans arisaemae TaxID=2720610 RepID=UPI0024B26B26|nr:DUF2332 domain-containing protein [Rhizohabitans arisaemae]